MAAEYIDYLIADPVIIPPSTRAHYSEKILYLPSYQPNDSQRRIAERIFSREELGLPAAGLVFCCFNTSYKISPEIFAGWMRILGEVPGSVLWLLGGTGSTEANLRAAAQRHGVEAARLVFGGRLPFPEYLARFRAADLFLDTLPYNAGTTASDALWAGLPVLTCMGTAFAARVAGSLLTALELPELITTSLAEYEHAAIELARDPSRLEALRQRLLATCRRGFLTRAQWSGVWKPPARRYTGASRRGCRPMTSASDLRRRRSAFRRSSPGMRPCGG
jgi:predicted O-linked N-acetylglucosamine transferase (SPINDLY family)